MTSQEAVRGALRTQIIEVPSWAYGNSGTRFKVFAQAGVPRDPYEKIADAAPGAPVHRGRAEGRPAHPVGPGRRLRQARLARGGPGHRASAPSTPTSSRTTTTCSARVTNPDPRVRRKAIDHLLECVDIMDATGSRDLKLWFSDGTNYPGQDDLRRPAGPARRGAAGGVRPARPGGSGCCWSTSCSSRRSTRPTCPTGAPRTRTAWRSVHRRQVVHRHRPPRAGHEHRVHRGVPAAGRAGSAGSTSTPASTPTTTSWSARPTRSSCSGSCTRSSLAGCDRLPAVSGSRSCSTSATTSSRRSRPDPLGDERAGGHGQGAAGRRARRWRPAQRAGDVLGANAVLMDAYNTDVRPLLRDLREELGLRPGPDRRVPRLRLRRADPDRAGRRHAGPGGAPDVRDVDDESVTRGRSAGAQQPARSRPAQHQLRRRQHLGQGHRDRSGDRRARWSCCGSRGPAATSAR